MIFSEKHLGIMYKAFKELMDNQIQNFGGASIEVAEIVDMLEAQLCSVIEPIVEPVVEEVIEPVVEEVVDPVVKKSKK